MSSRLVGAVILMWLCTVIFSAIADPLPRVWIDTDTACGVEGRVDPDDCFALVYLLSRAELNIVGISTVFGNASLEDTDRIAREIADDRVPVFRGAAWAGDQAETPASLALTAALEAGPLTILALGPLTNVAAVLSPRPTLAPRIEKLVAVMGKREGHLFHPSEGSEKGILFGHGPIFSDFNFRQDPGAVQALIEMPLTTVLIPYELSRQVMISALDLNALVEAGGLVGEIAQRSAAWLSFWQHTVGKEGFFPFDLVAAAYLTEPEYFSCRRTGLHIAEDTLAYGPLPGPEALMITDGQSDSPFPVQYCEMIGRGLHGHLLRTFAKDANSLSAVAVTGM
jgi:inosine-uridine nucleoside N-ribohydrolase